VERFKLTICGLKGCWYQGEGFCSNKAFEKAVKRFKKIHPEQKRKVLNKQEVK
jgi:hypothetical protein